MNWNGSKCRKNQRGKSANRQIDFFSVRRDCAKISVGNSQPEIIDRIGIVVETAAEGQKEVEEAAAANDQL